MKPSASHASVILIAAVAMLEAGVAMAQDASPSSTGKISNRSKASLSAKPSAADLKPSGAVTVTAKTAELVQGNSAIYTGNVVLTSSTLKLDGDRVELKQYPGGQYEARITGGPAHMNHAGAGADNPSVAAHAKTLNYDTRNGVLDLIGDAYILRGSDEITGDTIRYNVNERRIQAGGGDGQVKIIIQPTDAPADPDSAPAPEKKP